VVWQAAQFPGRAGAPHCPQNGPRTGSPQEAQKEMGETEGGKAGVMVAAR